MEAQAGVAAANENIQNARARMVAAEANLRAAVASRDRTAKDLERYKALIAKDEIPRQQFDAAVTACKWCAGPGRERTGRGRAGESRNRCSGEPAAASRSSGIAGAVQCLSRVDGAATDRGLTSTGEHAARQLPACVSAAVDQARLNLDYTVIRAPVKGIVGRRSVQIGQNVQPGQPLFSIVEVSDLWVTAMFKETQLAHMRPGQPVTVEVDAFGGEEMRGHVDSIGAATGATFSVLPSENASGNYVKVVQRIPVKIVFEPNQHLQGRLRPGMSVVPTVLLK